MISGTPSSEKRLVALRVSLVIAFGIAWCRALGTMSHTT
jgi:hypothetical protein